MLLRVMGHTDEQLEYARQKMQKVETPDAYVNMYLNVLEWEIKRRCVKAEYIASLPKPTLLDIVLWECEISTKKKREIRLPALEDEIKSQL